MVHPRVSKRYLRAAPGLTNSPLWPMPLDFEAAATTAATSRMIWNALWSLVFAMGV